MDCHCCHTHRAHFSQNMCFTGLQVASSAWNSLGIWVWKVIFLANVLSAWRDNKMWAREQTDRLLFPPSSSTSVKLFSQNHKVLQSHLFPHCQTVLSSQLCCFIPLSPLVKETICVCTLFSPHPLLTCNVLLPLATSVSFSGGREKGLKKCWTQKRGRISCQQYLFFKSL